MHACRLVLSDLVILESLRPCTKERNIQTATLSEVNQANSGCFHKKPRGGIESNIRGGR